MAPLLKEKNELGSIFLFVWITVISFGKAQIISTFNNPLETNSHLAVDKFTGSVYLGVTNRIYQLDSKLSVFGVSNVGPYEDSLECFGYRDQQCPENTVTSLTDNYNKVLVIDYARGKLIHCGSVFQGLCWITGLANLSNAQAEIVDRPIVANDKSSSTVAFIAPGPPNPQRTHVLNVATTYTGNSKYRVSVPSISSRSLSNPETILDYAGSGIGMALTPNLGFGSDSSTSLGKTQIFIRNREEFPVKYVYGFSSNGFSYFLSVQKRAVSSSSMFSSRIIRVCQNDPSYKSYAEIPIECKGKSSSRRFPLIQSAYLGRAGSMLAKDLEDGMEDDVLYATFSMASPYGSSTAGGDSALCIYPMRDIRKKFQENIQSCFNGQGMRGLDFIKRDEPCIANDQEITEDFCGIDLNSPLGGRYPILSESSATFGSIVITSIATTITGEFTVAFLGTNAGEIKKVVIKGLDRAEEYESVTIDRGNAIKSDMAFDPSKTHLYVFTAKKLVKLVVHNRCSRHLSCSECTGHGDPFCGWCPLKNRCTIMSSCPSTDDPIAAPTTWISTEESDKCGVEQIHCPDLATTCFACVMLDPSMNCGWCTMKNSCLKTHHCPAASTWLDHTQNCSTNPQITSFFPKTGPIGGGTNMTITIQNMKIPYGFPSNDVYLVITIAGFQCTINPRSPFLSPSGSFTCQIRKVPSILAEPREGPVVIRGPEFRIESKENFTFVETQIYTIGPVSGPLRGGTKLKVYGDNLDAGSEALAYVGDVPCLVSSRENRLLECTTQQFFERGTFGVTVTIDGNEAVLPLVFNYVDNPVILRTKNNVIHGTLRGGNHVTAEGRHLDAVQNAFFVVTLNETEYYGPCNVTTPETLQCFTPKIEEAKSEFEETASLDPNSVSAQQYTSENSHTGTNSEEDVVVIPYKFQLDTVDTFVSGLSPDKHLFFLRLSQDHHHDHDEHYDGESSSYLAATLVTIFLVIVIAAILVFFLLKRQKRRAAIQAKQRILTTTELDEFQKGKPKFIEKGVLPNENPYIIPYNPKFEIPPRRYTVDRETILGSGQFGVVMKGSVDANPVAVKTLKSDAEKMHLLALMSELKILIHLGNTGKHPNIVNLVGANTKFINRGTLYMFVEYCPLGSLENFLRGHRGFFVNQVDNDLIDLSSTPEPYQNFDPSNMLCTLDLINYSHQIARGMEYLAEKKVMHADLAARNLLVYDRTTIKITDFGLARKLYDYTNYVKKHQEPLPWRWMAIESLRDLSFSTQSDVWAFGITLWEIFTLGDLPYPGLAWTVDFTDRLLHGLQNVKPRYASSDIYNTMLECWRLNPDDRPSFSDIRKFFNALLLDLSSQIGDQIRSEEDKDAEGYLVPLLSKSAR